MSIRIRPIEHTSQKYFSKDSCRWDKQYCSMAITQNIKSLVDIDIENKTNNRYTSPANKMWTYHSQLVTNYIYIYNENFIFNLKFIKPVTCKTLELKPKEFLKLLPSVWFPWCMMKIKPKVEVLYLHFIDGT